MNLEKLLQKNPFKIKKKIKYDFFNNMIKDLTFHHYKFCEEYKKIILNLNINIKKIKNISDFPMLPVRLFKYYDLKSVKKKTHCKETCFLRHLESKFIKNLS